MTNFKKSTTRTIISQFWHFTKPDKWLFTYSLIGSSLGVLLQEILPPVIVAQTFNKIEVAAGSGQAISFKSLLIPIAIYIILSILGLFFWRTQDYTSWNFELNAIKRIFPAIQNHLQNLDSDFHANRFGGSLVSQANKFAGAYERTMDDLIWGIVPFVTAYIASMIVLFVFSPIYATALLLFSVIYFIVLLKRTVLQIPKDRDLASSESTRTAKLADGITNIATIFAFASQKHEKKLFKQQVDATHKKYRDVMQTVMTTHMISHVSMLIISVSAFVIGIYAITNLNAPIGTLFLAITYTLSLSRRLRETSKLLKNLNRSFGDANDMSEILTIKTSIKDKVDATELSSIRGQIEFKNVTFGFEADEQVVFKNLNLRIKAGETIGLIGRSGGGKTTLSKLILRLMDVQKGDILIDGQPIKDVTLTSLRQPIAYVAQEPLLFHRTIKENIAYAKPDASDQEIRAIAKLASANEFIDRLPNGYDTLVGERGVKLSGGQRQRVAIARAMLKNAPILLLDEATSALDSESEAYIQSALSNLMKNRTAIVIAHRLSTIQKMDRIIVLDNGKIVEEGSHRELTRKGGKYAELWNRQSGGFIED